MTSKDEKFDILEASLHYIRLIILKLEDKVCT